MNKIEAFLDKTENENEVIIKFRDDITALDGGRKDTLSKKGEY